ncbi:class I SAM-dependent methyltransferase [Thalassospira sp. GO-4]|jgi:ubiquinone/menaquinone biosynthesis C-methylase UbiE|uniref:class I SAM-dependent methyltransferase n=1 Tax=Thalassospira sp. GO-4 TaxID=2946605 RepID=UPI0020255CBE|nr:class I SAM-dependent methyltransferase [Thalassospira sp. GO-4]URK17345.1 class I SAM-dependent methyltransferase [Thalassospira sp. GO-4]
MNTSNFQQGSQSAFDDNWQNRSETDYVHWTKTEPANQIQFAFRQHWLLFNELLEQQPLKNKEVLEVGCGRGSLSMYFADAGCNCTLIDSSEQAISTARRLFARNGLNARIEVGNALELNDPDDSYDVVFSIGLLEHFDNIAAPLAEQVRVLKPGGTLFVYVVPEDSGDIQRDYEWINDLLQASFDGLNNEKDSTPKEKEEVYRNGYLPQRYVDTLKTLGIPSPEFSGVYSVPMISHSIYFPFTLNNPEMEKILTRHFSNIVSEQTKSSGKNGWLCEAGYGNAFLVWGKKAP